MLPCTHMDAMQAALATLNNSYNKTGKQMKKLNKKGFSHQVVLLAFIVVFAIAGVGYLVATHAASSCKRTFGPGSKSHCVKDIQGLIRVMGPKSIRHLKADGKY